MRRADPPSMDPGSGEWRPGDVRLWTKDELITEITRLDADIRRLCEDTTRRGGTSPDEF